METFDLAIVGAGPAGLSASVYASRYGMKNIVIGEPGGLTTKTHKIGNWLGTESITGFEFAQNALNHAKSYKADVLLTFVNSVAKENEVFHLALADGTIIHAKTILLATGSDHRKLGVPGEESFAGKGVSYCATCDGFFYKNKAVAVVGGSDSAAGAALFMSNIAEKVYVIYRGEKLRAEKYWVEQIEKNPKIEVITNSNIAKIEGEAKVERVVLDTEKELKVDGIFVEIGFDPNSHLVKNLDVALDEDGYIKIEADGRTTAPGIWAAGDITTGSNKFKQIVTAAAEGAIAAHSIQKFLK